MSLLLSPLGCPTSRVGDDFGCRAGPATSGLEVLNHAARTQLGGEAGPASALNGDLVGIRETGPEGGRRWGGSPGSGDDVPGSGAIAAFLRSAPPRSSREAVPCASQCAAIAERRLIGVATGFTASTLKGSSSSMSSYPRPPATTCGPAALALSSLSTRSWSPNSCEDPASVDVIERFGVEAQTVSRRGPSCCRCCRGSRCRVRERKL